MIPPVKPFPDYKWRWATLTPTEGLNEPPIYLGVLRVLRKNEGNLVNSPEVESDLARVQSEVAGIVDTSLHLVRDDPDRNVFRNSGQYWKALGLLDDTRGGIRLAPLGQAVADGRVTRDEFAATVVKTLELPNRAIQSADSCAEWDRDGLRIRPLQLLLEILRAIAARFGVAEAFLTNAELVRIVIPLAGSKSPMREYVESVVSYRQGRLDIRNWPSCAPASNDRRMAREFLLFLDHYGFCRRIPKVDNDSDQFVLSTNSLNDLETLVELQIAGQDAMAVVEELRENHIANLAERQRVLRSVLDRPEQGRFRRSVLQSYNFACLLTGERIPETLEAAHIIPVKYHGRDVRANGICFRSDIHTLFDLGYIRIDVGGHVAFSDVVVASAYYRTLPREVRIPAFVARESLAWRWSYQ